MVINERDFKKTLREGILIVPLFFVLLFVALFLGDGRQAIVDMFVAGGVLFLWVIADCQKQKIRILPTTTILLWVAVFVAYAASTLFSDSVGYSISSITRVLLGFLAYRLFYSLSSPKLIRVFAVGMVVFVGLSAGVAAVYIFFPSLARGLPTMNLLYANYGHNQLAGLLLFGIPLVIGVGVTTTSWCKKVLFILFLFSMVFSFARGAWILSAAYLVFLLGTKRLGGKINTSMAIIFVGAVAGLLVTISLSVPFFAHVPSIMNSNWWYKQTIKPSVYENRVEYWIQAVRAIQERPIFGSGPGTFYLQSVRLQRTQSSSSWFAHSFPLETLVELGVLGALPLFFLLFHHGREIVRGLRAGSNGLDARHGVPLALAAGLTLVYSAYEYNMNYLVVWLLFWATVGLLLGAVVKPGTVREGGRSRGLSLCLFIVCAYCVSSAASLLFSRRPTLAFLIAPYNTNQAFSFLEEKEKNGRVITKQEAVLLNTFHRKNPQVLMALARNYEQAKNNTLALTYYELSIHLDPLNEEHFMAKESFYLRNGEYWRFFNEYKAHLVKKYPDYNFGSLTRVVFSDKDVDPDKQEVLNSQMRLQPLSSEGGVIEKASINLFILGYGLVKTKPYEAKQLFIVTRDLSPAWSYFHLALASYYYYVENQKELARNVLNVCLHYEYAGDHCADVMKHSMPTLDEIKDSVITIP